jgi:hypothetical protein
MYTTIEAADFSAPSGIEVKSRNGRKVVGLGDAAVEFFTKELRLPPDYDNGVNLTIVVWGAFAAATTNNARMRVEVEYLTPGASGSDIDADSYDTAVEVNVAAVSPAGALVSGSFSLTNAEIDAAVAGGRIRLRVSRVGNDATNDTAAGDFDVTDVTFSQA